MRTVLADTCYLVALINDADGLHDRAVEVSRSLGQFRVITTEMVLAELLSYLGKRGQHFRKLAAELVDELRNDPNTEIVPQTSGQFRRALQLYRDRLDKRWSLTDCASFAAMNERGIREALSHDEHFEQAGLVALLR